MPKGKCPVCGEEDEWNKEQFACAFNGCVHYVDALEKVYHFLVNGVPQDRPQFIKAIEAVKVMGAKYGRPFKYLIQT